MDGENDHPRYRDVDIKSRIQRSFCPCGCRITLRPKLTSLFSWRCPNRDGSPRAVTSRTCDCPSLGPLCHRTSQLIIAITSYETKDFCVRSGVVAQKSLFGSLTQHSPTPSPTKALFSLLCVRGDLFLRVCVCVCSVRVRVRVGQGRIC
jgi:hypothetical protein